MTLVLGVDASWTSTGITGVALLDTEKGVVALAPSYEAFVARCTTSATVEWVPSKGTLPNVTALIRAAVHLGGAPVDVVAIDMPMARKPITRRRKADDAVSKAFGAKGAGVHSPSAVRPGQHGERLTHAFINAGFPLVTEAAKFPTRPALIEVFPLAALVRLMQLSKRPCYKISKTTRYWPNLDKAERLVRLRMMWAKIASALQSDVENIDVAFPDCTEVKTFAALKPHEDALDAIVCAWVGRQYLAGNAEPFGNANASIWIPCTEKKP